MVCGLQHQKSELEASLAHMAEACRIMARDLGLEKAKAQELESRLTELYPSIDSLLQKLTPAEHKAGHPNYEEVNGHLLLENQRQRELIMSLQSTLQAREEAMQGLRSTLDRTVQELRLTNHVQHEPDRFNPDETKDDSSESCLEIITEKPLSGRGC